jgi:RNA polymerase primary sigma factor
VHVTEAMRRLTRASDRLAQRFRREARAEEIARELNAGRRKVHEIMRVFQQPISLEASRGEGKTRLGEFIADAEASMPDSLLSQRLSHREQTILRMYFGIGQSRS